jgi:transketolase
MSAAGVSQLREGNQRTANLRVALEQASTFGWQRYTDLESRIIGMKTFGASAPLKEIQRRFGLEPHLVVVPSELLLERR